MRMRLPFSLVWLIAFTSLAYPCAAQIATAWPEADQLFRSDPRWLGGDGAFSVDLGNGRVLWLFGDSFVASEPGRRRSESHMPRNTLAIQTGYDPSRASMKFYWRTRRGQPESFFREQGENWLWPMHGVKLGDHLLLFYNIISPDKTPKSLGFRGVGWTAFLVSNLAQDPLHWVIRRIHTPINPWNIMVGVVALLERDYVYVFSFDEPRHDAYLLRLSVGTASGGNLSAFEWWCGSERGWVAQKEISTKPAPVFTVGSTEFSVHLDHVKHRYVEVQSVGFGGSDISVRWSDQLAGPWSQLVKIYRPPESDAPDAFVYAGKAHVELVGADFIVTYVANAADERLAKDMSIYFPRFVRINLHE